MIGTVVAFGLMVVELFAAELVFARFLPRRDYFWARISGAFAIYLTVALWAEILYGLLTGSNFTYGGSGKLQDSVFKFLYYVGVFVMSIGSIKFSYRGSLWTVLFYCSGGYAVQHFSYNLSSLVNALPFVKALTENRLWISFIIEIVVCVAVYTAVWFLFIRRRTAPDENKDVRGKVLLFITVIFICIGISRITTDNPDRNTLSLIAESVSAIVSCVFILVLLFDLTDRDKAQGEVKIMKELLRREKEQYRMTKENIDLINIKCHDLKHQIHALRENASEQYIKKVEDAVIFYDSVVKTGNDVLDVILTEKSLLCERNGITFTCMARGEDLLFMDEMDIYSLFGNALTNAFESVRNVADRDRRCISVNVHSKDGMLSVHIENFYDGELKFKDGLPITEKDRDYHGFGLKSMKYVAEQYGGHMAVSAEEGIFSLDFLFPLPESQSG